ncbi:MAG: ATP-binding cassette domain-containing protein [Verrucomicrobia bacterium]|nr:ATP-binding cassette domain-containing protein [Verrucomicrobiota bacterium]MBS0637524.1 ATP-binding cassette domain-containing protein [Verrucomicrobiota bacterium]
MQFEQVTKAYGGQTVLDNVSFIMGKRERLGLVGRNGSGKTTLFRMITGAEEPDSGIITTPKGYKIGILTQHIHFSKPTILDEAVLGLPDEEKENVYKAEAILFGLGFKADDMAKSPSLFSGGYQLRLHLAKLLLSQPDCLLLDEPTNYLDILSIRWLAQFLRNWQGELIMVSHDRQFLDSVITHTLGIHRKGVKKVQGPTEKLFQQIALDEEVHEKTRIGLEKKKEHLQSFIDRFGAKNTKAAQAQARQKAINRMPSLEALCAIDNLHFAFPYSKTNSKVLLKAQNVSFGYSTPLFTDFSIEIEHNARLGIVGQNGKGKSTLLRLLLGELTPTSGTITLTSGIQIGYFGQSHIERLHLDNTVEDEIRTANPKLNQQEIRNIAGKMMFTQDRAEKKIGVLSGGERSRVVLGKLLANPCQLLLLDEPTNHLDVESMEAFMDALDEFEGAVCLVTHSELVLERLATKLVVFHAKGQEQFLGTYEEFLQKGGWQDDEEAPVKKESSHKEAKRARADLVQERSRALKPYLQKQEQLENSIIKQEKAVDELNQKILDAVQQGKTQVLGDYTKALKDAQKAIDDLFNELETTSIAIEKIKLSFV